MTITINGVPQDMRWKNPPQHGTPGTSHTTARPTMTQALVKSPTFQATVAAGMLTGGTLFLLWRQQAMRQAVHKWIETLPFGKKNTAPLVANRESRVSPSMQRVSEASEPSKPLTNSRPDTTAKPSKKPMLAGHLASCPPTSMQSSADKQLSNAVISRAGIKQPSSDNLNTLPDTSLRSKLPSKKNLIKWFLILGGTAATVLLGRTALSRYGGKIPFGEGFSNKLNNIWEVAASKFGYYKGKKIPTSTEYTETNCNSPVGEFLSAASAALRKNPHDLTESCNHMSKALKAIGYTKPLNNFNPKEVDTIKKQLRQWELNNHPDKNKGITSADYHKISGWCHNFIDVFDPKNSYAKNNISQDEIKKFKQVTIPALFNKAKYDDWAFYVEIWKKSIDENVPIDQLFETLKKAKDSGPATNTPRPAASPKAPPLTDKERRRQYQQAFSQR